MNIPPRRFYEFSSYRVDVAERQLWRDGVLLPLTPKVFDILLVLLENAGRTVHKDRLMDRVWSDTFVEEGNLNRNISTLRKALGDDAQRQILIKTIPKRGYRFTSEIREIVEDQEAMLVEDRTRLRMRLSEEKREGFGLSGTRSTLIVAAASLLCISTLVAVWIWTDRRGKAGIFEGVGPEDSAEARKLYEQARALWKTRDGRDLHRATLLLERSVALDPGFAKAHAALGDAYAFDSRLWKKAEASARRAIEIDPDLAEPHATIGLVKMMWEWKPFEAEQALKEAIRLDPEYATARQWYAINLHAIGQSGHAAMSEMKRALELDPESVSINADMCQTLYFVQRIDDAIAQCHKTLQLDPRSHNAHQYLFEIYCSTGRYDEAVEMYFRLNDLELTPLPPDIAARLRTEYEEGGINRFFGELIEYLTNHWPQKKYSVARMYAWVGDTDRVFKYLDLAIEERSFGTFLVLSDPAFEKYREDERFKRLAETLLEGRESFEN